MALTYDDLTGKTNRFIVPSLVDSVYKVSPVLTRLRTRNRMKFEGGRSILQPLMYARLKGGAFARGQAFDVTYVQTDTSLELLIKQYYVNATLYGTDHILNRGPEAAMSLIESKMANAAGRMAELLATDMYLDGQGTNSSIIALDGFQASIDDGTNFATYGGITRSDLATGANVGIDSYYLNVAGNMALSTLQTAYGACWFGPERPDLLCTDQGTWNVVWNKLQPQQRFNEESTDVAKAGFQSLRFNGSSLTVDQYIPAQTIYGLNTNYIDLYVTTEKKYQFGFTGWKEAQNTDDVAGQYLFGGNLVNRAPRLMFRMIGITG
jgi:hypothetical protein